MVGSGLSNVAGPSLFFLTPAYTPEFYIDKLWLSENHVFFTIMILPRSSILLVSAWISLCFHRTRYAVVSPHELPGRFVSPLLLLLSAACDTCRHSRCDYAL